MAVAGGRVSCGERPITGDSEHGATNVTRAQVQHTQTQHMKSGHKNKCGGRCEIVRSRE